MLNKRTADFAEMVWEASHRLGNSATKIADEIMRRAFPQTCEEASLEGCDRIFRKGVVIEVKRILTRTLEDAETIDFSTIDPSFGEIVVKLKRSKYFVEALDEYVPVSALIGTPELLDDARRYLRRKGEETLAEAAVLDELYDAVTGRLL